MTLSTAARLLRSCCEEATSLLLRSLRPLVASSSVLSFDHRALPDPGTCSAPAHCQPAEGSIALRVQSIAPSATMPFGVGRGSWGPKPMVQAVQQKVDH